MITCAPVRASPSTIAVASPLVPVTTATLPLCGGASSIVQAKRSLFIVP
jgi:hypothetical protein